MVWIFAIALLVFWLFLRYLTTERNLPDDLGTGSLDRSGIFLRSEPPFLSAHLDRPNLRIV